MTPNHTQKSVLHALRKHAHTSFLRDERLPYIIGRRLAITALQVHKLGRESTRTLATLLSQPNLRFRYITRMWRPKETHEDLRVVIPDTPDDNA